ncbi:MAG: hypothetical protein ACKO7N_04840 [Candidatus Nitrosotenuis sp.]
MRRPNVLTAFGILFLISAAIMPIQDLIVWGPEYVEWFYVSPDITAEKLSIGVLVVGIALILVGYLKADSLFMTR